MFRFFNLIFRLSVELTFGHEFIHVDSFKHDSSLFNQRVEYLRSAALTPPLRFCCEPPIMMTMLIIPNKYYGFNYENKTRVSSELSKTLTAKSDSKHALLCKHKYQTIQSKVDL